MLYQFALLNAEIVLFSLEGEKIAMTETQLMETDVRVHVRLKLAMFAQEVKEVFLLVFLNVEMDFLKVPSEKFVMMAIHQLAMDARTHVQWSRAGLALEGRDQLQLAQKCVATA